MLRLRTIKGIVSRFMNFKIIILLSLFSSLFACSLAKPVPDDLGLSLSTGAQLNPDTEGRSSPVVLRIYELSADTLFKDKDFFDIFDDEKAALADSLIKKQELELNPNESRKLVLQLDKKTKFLGLLAAFRNLDNSKWREVIEIQTRKPTGIMVQDKYELNIRLDKNNITLINH